MTDATNPDNQVDAPRSRYSIEYRKLARLVELAVLHFRQMHATIQFLPNNMHNTAAAVLLLLLQLLLFVSVFPKVFHSVKGKGFP